MAMRVNYLTNCFPTAGTLGNWDDRGFGSGGAGTHTLFTAGGPFAGSYVRKAWTTGTATALGTGIEITGGPQSGRYPTGSGVFHTFSGYVRTNASGKALYARIVHVDSAGATINIVDGTVFAPTANQWTRIFVQGGAAPAGTDTVRVILDVSTGTWAAGNYLDATNGLLERVDGLDTYFDGNNPFATWSGTPGNSYSNLYIPELSVTQYDDFDPVPRCEVLVNDTPPGFVTLRRTADARTLDVRGGVMRGTVTATTVMDTEVPFGVPATYQAELYDGDGNSIGFSATVSTTMPTDSVCIHQPMDPTLGVEVVLMDDSLTEIKRGFKGEVVYTDGATVGRWIGGRRRGLSGVTLRVEVQNEGDADIVQSLFGDYNKDHVPVVCVRTPPGHGRIPRTLFLAVPDMAEVDVTTRYGGNIVAFVLTGDEVMPPTPGLTTPLLGYDDTDAFYPTYSGLDTAYGTYLARDRDYSKAGYAGV